LKVGPTVAKAVQGLDDLIQKLEQAFERLDGANRPGSEEITEAISMAKMVRDQLITEQADANSKSLTETILFASAITKLIDRLLSVIFYFNFYICHVRHHTQRQYYRPAA
jgi:hypothetical protein